VSVGVRVEERLNTTGLDDRGFESRQGLGIFLFTTVSSPGTGTYPASYPMGIRGSYLGGKAAGA
jgi:hypothetical protein